MDQVVYGNCSPYVEERLGDFYEYLRSVSYRPPSGDLGDFITTATKLQIISLTGAGWSWEKKPYVPNQLLPRDTFQYPKKTWGLNRDNVWRCCGYTREHPGCWTGPIKYEYTPFVFKVDGSVTQGTYWKDYNPLKDIRDGKVTASGEYYEIDLNSKKKVGIIKQISNIIDILNNGILYCDTNNFDLARESLKRAKDLYSELNQEDDDIEASIKELKDCIKDNDLNATQVLDSDDDEDDFGNDQGGVVQALDLLPPLPHSPIKSEDDDIVKQIRTITVTPDNIPELESLIAQLNPENPLIRKIRAKIVEITNKANQLYVAYASALSSKDLTVNIDDVQLFTWQRENLRLERSKWVITPDNYRLGMDSGFAGRVGLKWCENSCWIDTIFTSLFLLRNTSIIREILESPRRLNIKDGCTAQKYHDVLLKDILTLQQSEKPEPSVLRRIWNNCVEENPPEQGEFYSATEFLNSFIRLYNLKNLEISSNTNSESDWLYLDDEKRNGCPLQYGEYTRTALILWRNKSHFLTILYDYTKDESWFINVNSGDDPKTIVQKIPRKEVFDYNDLEAKTKQLENPDNNPYTYESVAAVYMRDPKRIVVPNDLNKQTAREYYRTQEAFIRRFRGESDEWHICKEFSPGTYDGVEKITTAIRIFLWLGAHEREKECKDALDALRGSKTKYDKYYAKLIKGNADIKSTYVMGAVNEV